MIEYLRYLSGHWQASCTTCGAQLVTETVGEAFTRGRAHDQVCAG
jgi:ribosomal protein S27E